MQEKYDQSSSAEPTLRESYEILLNDIEFYLFCFEKLKLKFQYKTDTTSKLINSRLHIFHWSTCSRDSADLCGRYTHYLYAGVGTVLTSVGGLQITCIHE